jgi:hypothetical protein
MSAMLSVAWLQDGASDQEVGMFVRRSWGSSVSSSARSSALDAYTGPAVFEGDSSLRSSACSDSSSRSSSVWEFLSSADSESSVDAQPVIAMEPLPQGWPLTVQQVAAYLPAGSSEADFQLERVRMELAAKRQQVEQVCGMSRC